MLMENLYVAKVSGVKLYLQREMIYEAEIWVNEQLSTVTNYLLKPLPDNLNTKCGKSFYFIAHWKPNKKFPQPKRRREKKKERTAAAIFFLEISFARFRRRFCAALFLLRSILCIAFHHSTFFCWNVCMTKEKLRYTVRHLSVSSIL